MAGTDAPTERDLRDTLQVVAHRKWWVIATMLVIVGFAFAASYVQTPRYAATTEVLFRQTQSPSLDGSVSAPANPERLINTEREYIQSQAVRTAVEEELGREVDITAVGDTKADVIRIRASATDPVIAAESANVWADTYIELRREASLREYEEQAAVLQGKIDELDQLIDERRIQITQALPFASGGEDNAVVQSLEDEIADLNAEKALWQTRLNSLSAEADLISGNVPEILNPATAPASPYEPATMRNLILAVVFGVVLGIGLAFLVDYLDDSIKTKEDLERATGGLTTLALIPRSSGWRAKDDAWLESIASPTSPTAEAYRSLRTSLQFKSLESPIRTILVTSPRAADGKSTTVANLAVALARADQRVVVMSCDLRRPRVHDFFGVPNAIGFTSVLVGDATLASALQPVPGMEHLVVLPSGPIPPNPSELLSSARTKEIVQRFASEADVVLIDSPPVLPVADALVLSEFVDAVILVANAGNTTRKGASRASELLRDIAAPVIGTVLCNADGTGRYTYEEFYGYNRIDGPSDPGTVRRRSRRRSPSEEHASR
jgi:non-specific protein-tyrosine kinase